MEHAEEEKRARDPWEEIGEETLEEETADVSRVKKEESDEEGSEEGSL